MHKLLTLETFNNYAQISLFLKEYGEQNEAKTTLTSKFIEAFKREAD